MRCEVQRAWTCSLQPTYPVCYTKPTLGLKLSLKDIPCLWHLRPSEVSNEPLASHIALFIDLTGTVDKSSGPAIIFLGLLCLHLKSVWKFL